MSLNFYIIEYMLKYLFTASFKNGEIYSQSQEDVSIIDPARSCFYDILQKDTPDNPLELFCLADGTNDYLVDLRDGSFMVNGVKFNVHNSEIQYFNRRLIYFRRNTLSFNVGYDQIGKDVIYKLGWQANDSNGYNAQFVIEIT